VYIAGMFLFSVKKSFAITNHINKALFAEALVNKLLPKLHTPNVAITNDGYELVFSRGFTEVLIRLNWISEGVIKVAFSEEQIQVRYELNFRLMFWLCCFITIFLLVSILTEYFSLRPGSSIAQWIGIGILWSLYGGIIYFTTVIFDLRMGKTINEVELSYENISDEQLGWMNRTDVCPACGHTVESNSIVCPDCGLRL